MNELDWLRIMAMSLALLVIAGGIAMGVWQ